MGQLGSVFMAAKLTDALAQHIGRDRTVFFGSEDARQVMQEFGISK
jgi:hypothetical protein